MTEFTNTAQTDIFGEMVTIILTLGYETATHDQNFIKYLKQV